MRKLTVKLKKFKQLPQSSVARKGPQWNPNLGLANFAAAALSLPAILGPWTS